MRTQRRKAKKRRGTTAAVYLCLILALCGMMYLIYNQMRADAVGLGKQTSKAAGYKETAMDSAALAQGDLVLVNKTYKYDITKHTELSAIFGHKKDSYLVRDKNVLLGSSVLDHLNDLMEGFYKAKGIGDVNVVSGYRTYEDQQKLYNNSLDDKGKDYTEEFLAKPGFSEHHTGLAVDFAIFHTKTKTSEPFDGSGDYGWFSENSWQYGFILRYPKEKSDITKVGSEPWHFRYVGVPHASYMKEHSLCMEEYIDLLRQYPFDGKHLSIECDGHTYEVYFCSGMKVHVPEHRDYTISGNNVDGFIVTEQVG